MPKPRLRHKKKKRPTFQADATIPTPRVSVPPPPTKKERPAPIVVKPFVSIHYRETSGHCDDLHDVTELCKKSFYNEDLERVDFTIMLPDDPWLLKWNPHDHINLDPKIQPVYSSYDEWVDEDEEQPFHPVSRDVQFYPKFSEHLVTLIYKPEDEFSGAVGQHFSTINPGACLRAILHETNFLSDNLYLLIYSYLDPLGRMLQPQDLWCFYARYYYGSNAWLYESRSLTHDTFAKLQRPEYHWTQEEARMIRDRCESRRYNQEEEEAKLSAEEIAKKKKLSTRIQVKFRYPALYSYSEMLDLHQTLQLQAIASARLQKSLLLLTLR